MSDFYSGTIINLKGEKFTDEENRLINKYLGNVMFHTLVELYYLAHDRDPKYVDCVTLAEIEKLIRIWPAEYLSDESLK